MMLSVMVTSDDRVVDVPSQGVGWDVAKHLLDDEIYISRQDF